jgi:hypothetical protein
MSTRYPRTYHLPNSPGASSDDRRMADTGGLLGEIVVTEKMDGGNYTMTRLVGHGRSPSSTANPWDSPARAMWSVVRHDIPQGWRVCGESLHATRSVAYGDLVAPFLVFGVFDDHGILLPWDETEQWSNLLGLPIVPVLYRGSDLPAALTAWGNCRTVENSEGFVVRRAGAIAEEEFPRSVGKWVRPNHVRTDATWRHRNDHPTNGYRRWDMS